MIALFFGILLLNSLNDFSNAGSLRTAIQLLSMSKNLRLALRRRETPVWSCLSPLESWD
jgi:hypothetical protein